MAKKYVDTPSLFDIPFTNYRFNDAVWFLILQKPKNSKEVLSIPA